MSSAIDANIMVYGANDSAPHHEQARTFIGQLALGPDMLYLFWPVVLAYLRVTTHPALFAKPLSLDEAFQSIEALSSLEHVRLVGESARTLDTLRDTAMAARARGKLIHDAHIVVLMKHYGVSTIYTHDRDFRKFDGIRVIDPFA